MLTLVTSALALGLLGSLHCALMCGPLLVAGCSGRGEPRARGVLEYFGGRLASHAFAGAVLGQLGSQATRLLSSAALQGILLSAVATAALIRGLRLIFSRPGPPLVRLSRRGGPSRWARAVASLLPRRALPLGLATGALPCGLLAAAWALAASTGHPLRGALVMTAFSVATAPGLGAGLLVSLPLARSPGRWSPAWQGLLWCALAVWLGLRPVIAHAAGACH